MVALSQDYQSRARFHLIGTGAGIPAGDLARVQEAINQIPDTIQVTYVQEAIDTCDSRWQEVLDGSAAISLQLEEYSGDLNRTIARSQRNQQTIDFLYRAYYRACEHLARILWCPIFTTPDSDAYRFARSGGEYVNSLPGTNGMPGFHLMYKWNATGGTANPGLQFIGCNNPSNLPSVTSIRISETDRKNRDVSNVLNYLGANSLIQLNIPASEDYACYRVDGVADSGFYRQISVTWLQGSVTTIENGTNINLAFMSTVTGTTGDLLIENAQTGTSYTLTVTDRSKVIAMFNSSPNQVIVPADATVAYAIGTLIYVYQSSFGQTSITPSGGVTLLSANAARKLRTQYSWGSLFKPAVNTWILSGDIIV